MKGTKVATRYAKSLLEIAIEQNNIDSVSGDMQYLFATNRDNRDFQILLSSPIVKADKKIAIFEAIFDQFETSSMAFVRLITKNGRERYLPDIAEAFDAQVKEFKGIVPVSLISATQLDNATKDAILDKVRTQVAGSLEVTEQIDPELIGGFIVRMGDRQIDASVASQLNNLKQQLTR